MNKYIIVVISFIAVGFIVIGAFGGCFLKPEVVDGVSSQDFYSLECIREATFIDINGDTIIIQGGATCHIHKK